MYKQKTSLSEIFRKSSVSIKPDRRIAQQCLNPVPGLAAISTGNGSPTNNGRLVYAGNTTLIWINLFIRFFRRVKVLNRLAASALSCPGINDRPLVTACQACLNTVRAQPLN